MLKDRTGLAPDNVRAAIDDSLRRLQTDYIDLYYAHEDDQDTPLEETLGAFGRAGPRGQGAAHRRRPTTRLRAWRGARGGRRARGCRATSRSSRTTTWWSAPLRERASPRSARARTSRACPTRAWPGASSPASTATGGEVDSPRAGAAGAYLDDRGRAVLEALDEVAAAHDTTRAAVALAWLRGPAHGGGPDRQRAQPRAAGGDPAVRGARAQRGRTRPPERRRRRLKHQ